MFVDRVRVQLRSGDGGAGVVSFLRQRGKPRGRPTGGSGGRGGAVLLEADPSVGTLLRYRRNPHHAARAGQHGSGDLKHGARGDDLVLPVPLGTVVYDDDGVMIADLVHPGQRVTALEGGSGGRGNAAFLSPRLRAPNVAEQGEYGADGWFTLEMKLLADAALIGFPNAGKSTLIARVSAAKPKIGEYPFTTLEPNLGVVSFDDREFVLADIPGLIEGAAQGKGLGHEFLRHVERARVLVVLLDPSITQAEPPVRQLEILLGELGDFSAELVRRPRLVAVNKTDLADAVGLDDLIGEDIHHISAVTGDGVNRLLHAIADRVDEAERHAPEREGFVLHRPAPAGFALARVGDTWVVEGLAASRAIRFSDLTNPQAVELASRRLARIGLDQALADAGAEAGDTVRIGDLEFEFTPSGHLPEIADGAPGRSDEEE